MSCIPVVDGPRSQTTFQPHMNRLASEKYKRWRKILAYLKDVLMRHKPKKQLGKAPGVQRSITAICKSFCEALHLVLSTQSNASVVRCRFECAASLHPTFRECVF